MHQETGEEIRRTERELRGEMQQMREDIKADVNAVRKDGEKIHAEAKENREANGSYNVHQDVRLRHQVKILY